MAEQYWIGDFYIDLSRNQITQDNHSQTLAPKALAVLTFLAENKGQVVSQDALLAHVWQGTVVSPNTLQRSIAQLRKALGDDGKVQVFIKTHAKQGYSLECEVSWQDNAIDHSPSLLSTDTNRESVSNDIDLNETKSTTPVVKKVAGFRAGIRLMSFLAGIIILGMVSVSFTTEKPATLSIGELRLLTTTDSKELASIYSPDGQYVVFHRYSEEFCVNNIWAKNTKTQQEFQLTEKLDVYGSHSFSNDGSQLVFIKTDDCSEPTTQKKCYQLMSLDFNQALSSPQQPKVLMECKNSEIRNAKWLNNDTIALFQKFSDRWKLITYSISDNKAQILYEVNEGNLIDYDYSASDDLIALISTREDSRNYISILKSDGQILSSHPIDYPKEIANFRSIYPNFSPFEKLLIFSTGRQLFTLSYDGKVTNISLPLDEPMGSPTFHPDGKKMLVIKGHYDSDIVSLPLSQLPQAAIQAGQAIAAQIEHFTNGTVIERSTFGEDSAMYQPNGDFIAYRSERSGEEQIWLTTGQGAQQLTHFPMDSYIDGMDWAADGNSMLANVDYQLIQIGLDGAQTLYPFKHRVERLFQWDSEAHKALVNMRIKGLVKFVELDLTHSTIRIINNKPVNWAQMSDKGQLIYMDHMDSFWQPGPAEDKPIEALKGQGSDKRFVIQDNVIYGINDNLALWSYALDEDKFNLISAIPNTLDYLTDINKTQLLMTVRIAARKDVAELSLR
jgi:transcriptional activator of cad operon